MEKLSTNPWSNMMDWEDLEISSDDEDNDNESDVDWIDMSWVVPAWDSPKHILNALDDSCIQKIFQYLTNLSDFLNASEVCKRFQDNAKLCFPTIFKPVCIFDDSKEHLKKVFGDDKIPLEEQRTLLKNFDYSIYCTRCRSEMEGMDLDTPPAQDSPKHILNALNDFCIQNIFQRFTNLSDFLNASEVCTRFQNNAKSCFPFSTFKEVCLFDGTKDYLTGLYGYDKILSSKQQQILLKHFGDSIHAIRCGTNRSFRAQDTETNSNLLRSIMEFCGQSLVKLAVNDYDEENLMSFGYNSPLGIDFIDLRNQFPALKVLELTDITVDNLFISPTLEQLKLRYVTKMHLPTSMRRIQFEMFSPALIPRGSYPNLVKLEFSFVETLFRHNIAAVVDRSKNNILAIIRLNPQIIDLRIFGLEIPLRDIHERLPNLEVFHCSKIEGELNDYDRFEKLKRIFIRNRTSDEEMVYLLKIVPNLEELRIDYCRNLSVNGIIQVLKSARHLTRLWLGGIELTCADYRLIMSTNRKRTTPCVVKLPEDSLDKIRFTANLYDLLYIKANHPNLNVIKEWWARNDNAGKVWPNLDIEFLESANFH